MFAQDFVSLIQWEWCAATRRNHKTERFMNRITGLNLTTTKSSWFTLTLIEIDGQQERDDNSQD